MAACENDSNSSCGDDNFVLDCSESSFDDDDAAGVYLDTSAPARPYLFEPEDPLPSSSESGTGSSSEGEEEAADVEGGPAVSRTQQDVSDW